MGTNFYAFSKDKAFMREHFGTDFELTDEPEFGYLAHLAKTSMGWKPLFQAHKNIRSVKGLTAVLKPESVKIIDEYNSEYTLKAFKERVIDFNKDNDKALPHTYIPDWIARKERNNCYMGMNFDNYFIDEQGFDFCTREFS